MFHFLSVNLSAVLDIICKNGWDGKQHNIVYDVASKYGSISWALPLPEDHFTNDISLTTPKR